MKKKKLSDLEIVVKPLFDEWAKAQDDEINKGLEKAKLKFTEEQKRHMIVIEEFLKIQTEIFQRLEKKLK